MKISVDTGNKQIKTPHCTFPAGLVEHNKQPEFGTDVLAYKGKYYTITNKRIPYMRNKTEDDRYFILTLFAIGYELQKQGLDANREVLPIDLLCGLPPAHFGTLRQAYINYFSRGVVDFVLNGQPYHIMLCKVLVFPQAMAIIAGQLDIVQAHSHVLVIDIGGFTVDILQVINGQLDLSVCDSLEYGTIKFYSKVISEINSKYDLMIDEAYIDTVFLDPQHCTLKEAIRNHILRMAQEYINDFLNHLREQGIILKSNYVIFAGGGSLLFKDFIRQSQLLDQYSILEDIAANAAGYEILAQVSEA